MNGIDTAEWDPSTDPHLPPDVRYTAATAPLAKATLKALLQRRLGLRQDPSAPLFAFVGRLTSQKAVDAILAAAPALMHREVRVPRRAAVGGCCSGSGSGSGGGGGGALMSVAAVLRERQRAEEEQAAAEERAEEEARAAEEAAGGARDPRDLIQLAVLGTGEVRRVGWGRGGGGEGGVDGLDVGVC
jgi:hypothetical protein